MMLSESQPLLKLKLILKTNSDNIRTLRESGRRNNLEKTGVMLFLQTYLSPMNHKQWAISSQWAVSKVELNTNLVATYTINRGRLYCR